jgi:hypothetical protein
MQTHDEQIEALARQIRELGEILIKQLHPEHKFCLTVEELAQRWILSPEAVRRLVRAKELKPLRGFRPFRFTLDEIRRYEQQDDAVDKRTALMGRRTRR